MAMEHDQIKWVAEVEIEKHGGTVTSTVTSKVNIGHETLQTSLKNYDEEVSEEMGKIADNKGRDRIVSPQHSLSCNSDLTTFRHHKIDMSNLQISQVSDTTPKTKQNKTRQLQTRNVLDTESSKSALWTCCKCSKTFFSRLSLKSHIAKAHQTKEIKHKNQGIGQMYKSNVNQDSLSLFHSEPELVTDIHLRDATSFTCQFCGCICESEPDRTCHEKCHKLAKGFKCLFCSMTFRIQKDLENHLCKDRKHHNASSQGNQRVLKSDLECDISVDNTSTSNNIIKEQNCDVSEISIHSKTKSTVKMKHKHKNKKKKIQNKIPKPAKSKTGRKIMKDDVENNKRRESEIKAKTCEICGKTFARSANVVVHMKLHRGERPFKCSSCNKAFRRSDHLKNHELIHFKEKPHHCSDCGETFRRRDHLKYHQINNHGAKIYLNELKKYTRTAPNDPKVKTILCDICGIAFANERNLKNHLKIHCDQGKFTCKFCGKSFNQSSNLNIHMRQHTGETPYKCLQCDQSFTTSAKLKTHARKHTGDLPFACSICGRLFGENHLLKMHMRIHTDHKAYQCSHCQKTFTHSSTLRAHVRTHTGARPYKCDLCDDAFAQISSLKYHKRTHSGEKPYSCHICGNSYTRMATLNIHLTRHTGQKRISCPHCEFKCDTPKHLRKHVSKVHGEARDTIDLFLKQKRHRPADALYAQYVEPTADLKSVLVPHADQLLIGDNPGIQTVHEHEKFAPWSNNAFTHKSFHSSGPSTATSMSITNGIISVGTSLANGINQLNDGTNLNNGLNLEKAAITHVQITHGSQDIASVCDSIVTHSKFSDINDITASSNHNNQYHAQTTSSNGFANPVDSIISVTSSCSSVFNNSVYMEPGPTSQEMSNSSQFQHLSNGILSTSQNSSLNDVVHEHSSEMGRSFNQSSVNCLQQGMVEMVPDTIINHHKMCHNISGPGDETSIVFSCRTLVVGTSGDQQDSDLSQQQNHVVLSNGRTRILRNDPTCGTSNTRIENGLCSTETSSSTLMSSNNVRNGQSHDCACKDIGSTTVVITSLNTETEINCKSESDENIKIKAEREDQYDMALEEVELDESEVLDYNFIHPKKREKKPLLKSKKDKKSVTSFELPRTLRSSTRKTKLQKECKILKPKENKRDTGVGESRSQRINSQSEGKSKVIPKSKKCSTQQGGLVKRTRAKRSKGPVECKICGQTFSRTGNLTTHMRLHTGEKPYICPVCDKRYTRSDHLKAHMCIHKDLSMLCNHCGEKFSAVELLSAHIQNVHDGKNPFVCSMCSFSCIQIGELKDHVKCHEEKNPFSCEVCEISFLKSRDLKKHMESHEGLNPFTCHTCDKTFKESSCLKLHMMTKHTGEKRFKCGVCQETFVTAAKLQRHIRTHSGARPYTCEFCGKMFIDTSLLKMHVRIHTNEKPYKCKHCDQCFTHRSTLRAHTRIHTGSKPYSCKICNASFAQVSSLTYHQRRHDGVKPYTCHICGNSYTRSTTLNIHMTRHTGQKRFSCPHCKYKCDTPKHLRKHITKAHSNIDLSNHLTDQSEKQELTESEVQMDQKDIAPTENKVMVVQEPLQLPQLQHQQQQQQQQPQFLIQPQPMQSPQIFILPQLQHPIQQSFMVAESIPQPQHTLHPHQQQQQQQQQQPQQQQFLLQQQGNKSYFLQPLTLHDQQQHHQLHQQIYPLSQPSLPQQQQQQQHHHQHLYQANPGVLRSIISSTPGEFVSQNFLITPAGSLNPSY